MTGNVAPDIVKPAPVSAAELIVTGAVPVDVNVTGWVDGVSSGILPKATLAGLMLSVGTLAFSCRVRLWATPPPVAVSTTVWAEVTAAALATNPVLVPFAGTSTVPGTVIAALLLARLTLKPPLAAA